MLPHQERIVREKNDLQEKLEKLTNFLSDPEKTIQIVGHQEFIRLVRQQEVMRSYATILIERVASF